MIWRLAAGAAVLTTLALPFVAAAGASAAGGSPAAGAQAGAGAAAAALGDTILAWGNNVNGQLGDGTKTTRFNPVTVHLPPGTTVTSVRTGCFHTLALTSTGQVLAWGFNGDGELGNGTTTDSATPVPVSLPA